MRSPSYVSVCLWIPPANFWMAEPIFMKLDMYIMATEPISTTYFMNPCVSVCVFRLSLQSNGSVKCIPPFGARQRLGKHVPAQRIHTTIEELLDASFSVLSVSYQRRVCGSVFVSPLSLLGNNSVKTFPRQRRIVGGVVFCAVRIVAKESGRFILPRTSCLPYKVGLQW
jgi:hypothetical protein